MQRAKEFFSAPVDEIVKRTRDCNDYNEQVKERKDWQCDSAQFNKGNRSFLVI